MEMVRGFGLLIVFILKHVLSVSLEGGVEGCAFLRQLGGKVLPRVLPSPP